MQPIGTLGNTRIIREEYVKELKGYREIFFYGLPVKLVEKFPVSTNLVFL